MDTEFEETRAGETAAPTNQKETATPIDEDETTPTDVDDAKPSGDDDAVVEKKISTEEKIPEERNDEMGKSQLMPDKEFLTIRNLDTGEEYVIGENDPDFEYNNFPLTGDIGEGGASEEDKPWYKALFGWLFDDDDDEKKPQNTQPVTNRFTKLSSFKFRRELGKGAFGRVLLAESKADGSLYALKIISKKNMRNADKRQAMAERDILHAMAHSAPHPFTTGLKFAFQSENNLYLGMEYLQGGNLKQLIQRFKTLPEEWVKFYAAELVLAVGHMHSMRVLYRDIKPHNVMIDSRGHIILIDYGLSKTDVSNPTGAMSLVGTPDYSAPEVLRTGVFRIENEDRVRKGKKAKVPSKEKGEYGYGMAADWWSVGVMIYEMLGGLPTFRGADLRQTYQRVLYADVVFKPEESFSPTARELLLGLIQRDPSRRLGSAANSPKDIMACSFFDEINWDDIYARVRDGPWVPPSPDKKRAKSTAAKPVGSKKSSVRTIYEDKDDDNSSEVSEVLHIRDSIIGSTNKSDPNRLADWSFMDEKALSAAAGSRNRF